MWCLLSGAKEKESEGGSFVHQVLKERLRLVDKVPDSVVVLVVAGVVAPEIAAFVLPETVPVQRAPPSHGDLVDVVDEVVADNLVAAARWEDREADVVVSQGVGLEDARLRVGEWRPVEVDSGAIARDQVVAHGEAIGLLESDAVPTGPTVLEQAIAC